MFFRYNYQGLSWALFILVLCGLPGDQFERSKLVNADLAIHVFLYAVLFFLLSVGFIKQTSYRILREQTLRKVFIITVVYGVIVEVLQGTVFIGRSIELSDMMFNAVGSLIGMLVFMSIYGRRAYL
jgi:VanZ family protein